MAGDILSGELEIAVLGAKTEDNRLDQEKLVEDAMCLVIPVDHKWAEKKTVPLKSLLNEPFIIREAGSGTLTSIRDSLSKAGTGIEHFHIIAEMGSTQAVIQGIKNKVGISILSTIAVSDALEAGELKILRIEGVNLKRCFFLTTHKHRSASPICRVFIRFIKDALGGDKIPRSVRRQTSSARSA
jgi:DNA-binding transcriptional LysR family regulator